MDTDRKRGEVAANLDNMSDRIAELQDATHEGGTIAEVLDPERARKP